MLTKERLKELLHYDPDTGVFTWLKPTSNRIKVGDSCKCKSRAGYVVVRIDGDLHYAHRLAWLYSHGKMPSAMIDHIDCDKQNNRLENLREADRSLNSQNRRVAKASSGAIGAYKNKNKWDSKIFVDGKSNYLGLFSTREEASAAYVAAKRILHKGNTL